jgi:hypothetical protein
MTTQAKYLKDALKEIGVQGRISVRTEINYKNGDIGKAWAVIDPLTEEQEKKLRELNEYIEIIKWEEHPEFHWVVRY